MLFCIFIAIYETSRSFAAFIATIYKLNASNAFPDVRMIETQHGMHTFGCEDFSFRRDDFILRIISAPVSAKIFDDAFRARDEDISVEGIDMCRIAVICEFLRRCCAMDNCELGHVEDPQSVMMESSAAA